MRALASLALALTLAACATAPDTRSSAKDPSWTPAQVPPPIQEQLRSIGRVIAPPPTATLYEPMQQREPYEAVTVTRDHEYGPDPRNRLDVFSILNNPGPRPVLVFVHGGDFMNGERRVAGSPFFDNIMLWAVRNGMVGVSMSYRLAPVHAWPAAQEDVADALGWVREHIAERGGDPKRIFLLGHGAGASHVAQYVAMDRLHVAEGGGIEGVVLLSGLYDPRTAAQEPSLLAYFGAEPAVLAERSALPGMAANRIPLLLGYAELDPPELQRQAEQAQTVLCNAGPCQPLLKLRGHSHMSEVYAINTPDHALTDAIKSFMNLKY